MTQLPPSAAPSASSSLGLARALRLGLCASALGLLTGCVGNPNAFTVERDISYFPNAPEALANAADSTAIPFERERFLADVYRPAGNGPFPGVLLIHGGGWSGGHKGHMGQIGKRLARQGFVAVSVNYRLSPDFTYPAQLHDVARALRWMHSNAADWQVDTNRIGAWGYSAGAHLAMMLAANPTGARVDDTGIDSSLPSTPPLQAVVAGGTPADLRHYTESKLVREFLGGRKEETPAQYHNASPLLYVSPATPPTYLYHGRSDKVVEIGQARKLRAALADAGVPAELSEVPLGHIAVFLLNRAVQQRSVVFLQEHLNTP